MSLNFFYLNWYSINSLLPLPVVWTMFNADINFPSWSCSFINCSIETYEIFDNNTELSFYCDMMSTVSFIMKTRFVKQSRSCEKSSKLSVLPSNALSLLVGEKMNNSSDSDRTKYLFLTGLSRCSVNFIPSSAIAYSALIRKSSLW